MLSANVTGCEGYTFQPYTIKDVAVCSVGILGLTPRRSSHWERPGKYRRLCLRGRGRDAANRYVPEIVPQAQIVIVVALPSSGIDETYGYGRDETSSNFLANEVAGIDVILAGHAHALVASQVINGVLITEPNYIPATHFRHSHHGHRVRHGLGGDLQVEHGSGDVWLRREYRSI